MAEQAREGKADPNTCEALRRVQLKIDAINAELHGPSVELAEPTKRAPAPKRQPLSKAKTKRLLAELRAAGK